MFLLYVVLLLFLVYVIQNKKIAENYKISCMVGVGVFLAFCIVGTI